MNKKIIFVLAIVVIMGLVMLSACDIDDIEDGTYVGYSQANRSYVEAQVTIENGDIVDVELTEFNNHGQPKGEDYTWDEFHEAMEVLPARFIEANDYEVDNVTEATGTTDKAKEAVKMALEKAEGVTEFDGTFFGASDPSGRGAVGVAWVTIEQGEITDIRLEEVADGEFKDENYGWDEFHEAKEEMPRRMIDANSYDVDIYTDATGSSEMWIQAVERAIEKSGWDL